MRCGGKSGEPRVWNGSGICHNNNNNNKHVEDADGNWRARKFTLQLNSIILKTRNFQRKTNLLLLRMLLTIKTCVDSIAQQDCYPNWRRLILIFVCVSCVHVKAVLFIWIILMTIYENTAYLFTERNFANWQLLSYILLNSIQAICFESVWFNKTMFANAVPLWIDVY